MFDWRRKKTTRRTRAGKKQPHPQSSDDQLQLRIPDHFLCPISLDLMKDPVTLSSGITYDRESIEKWLDGGNFTCPVTNLILSSFDQVPNHTLRKMIQEWCVENQNYGVERVPTPRIPVTSMEVSEILFSITACVKRLDQCGFLDLLNKIETWAFESERNRRCIVANGTAAVLAAAFDAFARADSVQLERNAVLEEILTALNWMFPLDRESQTLLTSQDSLSCIVWLMKNKQLSAKHNAIFVLQELSCDHAETLADIGVNEILLNFIKHPISRSVTTASLMLIFSMASSSNEKTKSAFFEMGLVSLLLNVMIDSERHICEVALGVVDALCDFEQGREEAYANALTMPVLVKKILRVSELATEYSVSTIWKLSKYEKKHQDTVIFEALQVGVFQKLVLLLQCGCGDLTKEKATELLKILNPYRPGLECIESADFKNLERSF